MADEKVVEVKVRLFRGYEQLSAIVKEILDEQRKGCSGKGFPSWSFINGVLSCKEILGEVDLWFHWGKLLIHSPDMEGKNAGEHLELDDWNTEEDGKITCLGRKQRDE